jgi:hypothetical protein
VIDEEFENWYAIVAADERNHSDIGSLPLEP